MRETLKAYWQDLEDVVESNDPKELTLEQALNRWADGNGSEGNFFGLIDEEDRTIQFCFVDSIPDHVGDASHLEIVLVDFPVPSLAGSYQKIVSIGESPRFIERAFELGASHENFDDLEFNKWQGS